MSNLHRVPWSVFARVALALAVIAGLLVATLSSTRAASPNVVISQVYGGGGNSGATLRNDFIELYNRGATAVDVTGWTVQYASASGTSWVNKTALSGTITPGHYYLIQEFAGTGGTQELPTPDATGMINLSATSGKLALVNSMTELTGSGCPFDASVVDFVGYGAADCAEGSAAPSLSNTAAAVRAGSGATDTDNNGTDFSAGAPNPHNSSSSPTTPPPSDGSCPAVSNLISIPALQGTTDTNTANGQTVTVRGVVIADFQGSTGQNGFYVQDPQGDGNPLTSDGLFIYAPNAIDVAAGDAVQVSGTASEYQGLTELGTVTAVTKCGTPATISPTIVDLPEQTNGDLERYEGMLITIPETLTVDQNYFQGRYGQVTLSSGGRLYQPTNVYIPGSPEAQALTDENARRLIVLDDASSQQNPNPISYIGTDNTLRAGDTTSGLTGVLDFGPINSNTSIRDYRLQPTKPVSFTRVNNRSAAPEPVGGNVKVASFNVLNYFNGDGQGGGFPTARGADTLEEFNRQRAKEIAALTAMNADVIGLMEMENDGEDQNSAIQDLVNGLNAATAPGTYTFVHSPNPGTDAIKVAMIYKPGVVTPFGAPRSDGAAINNRPPLAQTFTLNSNGEKFSVIVNHLKSKGSCPTSATNPDADHGDGQGCWNATRVQQAQELITFASQVKAAAGDNDVLAIGDFNSYGMEDPIRDLTANGFINEIQKYIGTTAYSYVFDGQSGYLDHALASTSLDNQVSDVTEWHINADEPSVIDYNTEFKPQDLYSPSPYRASDHDPVLIGLNLGAPAPAPNNGKYRITMPLVQS